MSDLGHTSSVGAINSAPVDVNWAQGTSHSETAIDLEGSISLPSPRNATLQTITPTRFGDLTSEALLTFIASRTTADIAPVITDHLERHVSKGSISGLRATMIQPFSNKYAPWPLLAWKEGDDIDVMAIFKVSNSVAPCSCLVHYGVGRCWGEQGKRWTKSYIAWTVMSMEYMEELFVAAWHVSGIIRPLNLDARSSGENSSRAEYISF